MADRTAPYRAMARSARVAAPAVLAKGYRISIRIAYRYKPLNHGCESSSTRLEGNHPSAQPRNTDKANRENLWEVPDIVRPNEPAASQQRPLPLTRLLGCRCLETIRWKTRFRNRTAASSRAHAFLPSRKLAQTTLCRCCYATRVLMCPMLLYCSFLAQFGPRKGRENEQPILYRPGELFQNLWNYLGIFTWHGKVPAAG
jgi:hypothetical protein